MYSLSLGIDPPEDSIEGKYENSGSDPHDESEVGVLWVVVGSLRDGGMSGSALFVFDDAHVVGVTGGEDDDGEVDYNDPIKLEHSKDSFLLFPVNLDHKYKCINIKASEYQFWKKFSLGIIFSFLWR